MDVTWCGRTLGLAVALCALHGANSAQADGRFTALTYNVAGLLEPFSSGDPAANTPLISCKIRGTTLVNVQEDFNYHAALYDSCDDHPYRSATSGGMGIGSGLNTLSYLPYDDWERVKWNDCNGVDCLTPKGFTHARVRLEEGVYVSLYNLHAQAQTEEADLTARRANVLQLLAFIEAYSPGDAIIVMGDTNTRYTRTGDNIREFLRHGFHDAWIERARGGNVPDQNGGWGLTACDDPSSGSCEVVDKVFYRDNAHTRLTPLSYRVDRTEFVDAAGAPLSDHLPVMVEFAYASTGRFKLSDLVGGPHGDAFNDVGVLPETPVLTKLVLRSGARVDRIEAVLSDGSINGHGGGGGSESSLTLAAGEWLSSVEVCTGQKSGRTRVFRIAATTSRGRVLAGGDRTNSCTSFRAPGGYGIVGFHGRSGDELDKVGAVYARVPAVTPGAAHGIVRNVRSGLCLDAAGANAAAGVNVQQWTCNGGPWQRWSYDPASGLVRSLQNPRICLDNGGYYGDGADVRLWYCTGNANQRFTVDMALGTVRMRTALDQVLNGVGTAPGDDVITWGDWGGENQRWRFEP